MSEPSLEDSLKNFGNKSTFQIMITKRTSSVCCQEAVCICWHQCLGCLLSSADLLLGPGSDHLSLFVAPCQQWAVESLCQEPGTCDQGSFQLI